MNNRKGENMSNNIRELKQSYLKAEEQLRDACRRAAWLERRLNQSSDLDDFDLGLMVLKNQEKIIQEIGIYTAHTRFEYAAANMATR